MLTEEVSKLNIGRSQLDLTYLSKGHVYNVNRMELIKNMATQLFMPGCDSHLPDFYLNGNWNGKDGFQINLDFKGFNFHYHNLYITGVPLVISILMILNYEIAFGVLFVRMSMGDIFFKFLV